MSERQLKITPISSAPSNDILENIITNMDTIDEWFERSWGPSDQEIYICSAGPSLKKFLEEKSDVASNNVTMAVKHSLPVFKKYNLSPNFCNVLDPRPIDKVSTLGHTRTDLYATAPKTTTFFVASMTHPSVTRWLLDNGYKVVGYHTMTEELGLLDEERQKKVDGFIITGGTCSATRAIELSYYLGFQSPTLVGFDSSFDGPRPTDIVGANGKQLYMKVKVDGKPFYTTGELIAQSQDMERLFSNPRSFISINLESGLETSLVDAIVKKIGNKTQPNRDWRHYLAV